MMHLTRRTLMGGMLGTTALGALPARAVQRSDRAGPARVRWIDGAPPTGHEGQTFGTAWPRGALRRGAALRVSEGDGRAVACQSWPTAYWPDGSVKWTAHALPAGTGLSDALVVAPGRAAAPAAPVSVQEGPEGVTIRSGALSWEIARTGDVLIRHGRQRGRDAVQAVRLLGEVRTGSPDGPAIPLVGRIERVTVEQRGPVRAVVRVEGRHQGGGRSLLPFVVRLYAYAGANSLRIMHSFVHDVDPARDFVSALGVAARVPMTASPQDRHVRMATGPEAMFAEAVRPLTGLRRDPGEAARRAQVNGRPTPPPAQMAEAVRGLLDRIPTWSDFTLAQLSANGFTLAKRTGEGHGWIDAAEGRRAPGLAYVGQPDGGAAIGARWFWERHPTQIDVRGAASDAAELTLWLWSPDARPMDLRPYRGVMGMEEYDAQNEGLDITYEDYEPGWDDARGIARTSELTLWALPATPTTAELSAMAARVQTPPTLMADPQAVHAAQVLGIWSLPDRTSANRTAIENQLVNLTDFYADEVDRRGWYGFWDHGDVMHTYDADRRQWRYDIGGFAWANSELSPDLWLWYQALRTGGARTYRLAEAMTRHTGEVDVYHLGRFAGLGTRHGVQHFSDSSKQPRVSNAAYRRIFYYLTADERVGDLMRALNGSDERLRTVEIGRKVPGDKPPPPPPGSVEMPFGTVWCSLAAAWLTEWERTGDVRWRDRLAAGMDSIGRMATGWFTGSAPFDLRSGRFRDSGARIAFSHLNAVFGAVEINAELLQLIDVPSYRAAWLDYCRWYNAPRAAFEAKYGPRVGSENLHEAHSRLTAYAAHLERDAALADRAAAEFFSGRAGLGTAPVDPRRTLPGGIVEWPGVSTNAAAQWGLAAIENLALIPDALDRARLPVPRRRAAGATSG